MRENGHSPCTAKLAGTELDFPILPLVAASFPGNERLAWTRRYVATVLTYGWPTVGCREAAYRRSLRPCEDGSPPQG
jgi:hypothetical protein